MGVGNKRFDLSTNKICGPRRGRIAT